MERSNRGESIFVDGVSRQRLALLAVAALVAVALLAATAGALSAPDVAQKKPLSACAKAKAALRTAKTKKAKAKAAARVKRACKKPKPKPPVKNVSLSLDTARAATQTIGPEGGSVTATAANGTTFTLALPKDALVGATEVHVIPVKSVTGLGGHARVAGAVQLEPEGLGLFKTATLTIKPSSLTGKPTQAFGWYGAGRTLGRYPSTRTGGRLELQITHFSGDGVAQGEGVDWSNWQSITDAMQAHYQQSVRPLMTKAETDDSVFVRAMQDYLGWARQIALLGLDESFTKELAGLAESAKKALRNYVDKSSERCVKQHKVGEITILVMAARQAALLGDEQQSDDAFEKAKSCGHFELDFETVMARTAPPPPTFISEIRLESHVRVLGLKLDAFVVGQVSGEKQLEYLSWNYTGTAEVGGSSCSYAPDATHLGDPFRVTSVSGLLPKLKAVAGPDGRPEFDPPSISLSVYPGKPTEAVRVECADEDGTRSTVVLPAVTWYYAMFGFLYSGQAEGDSFRIDSWDFLGGSVYARKTYERTRVSTEGVQQTVTERTTYDLRHTPQS